MDFFVALELPNAIPGRFRRIQKPPLQEKKVQKAILLRSNTVT